MPSVKDRSPQRWSRRASACGFTLVELLIVIGIIAVLIGILLPALNKARQSASAIACAANMRTIGQAMMNYAAENRGCIVPAGHYLSALRRHGNKQRVVFVGSSAEAVHWPKGERHGSWRRRL